MGTLTRKLFNVDGFPVFIDLTFGALLAFFVFQYFGDTFNQHLVALASAPIILFSIVLHELGHAWSIRRLGYGSSKILLWGMGGLCINRSRYSSRDGMLIALAGPGAGLLVGIPALLALMWMGRPDSSSMLILYGVLYWIVFVNVGWSLLNLLPIFPLDGGRVVVYALRHFGKMDRDRSVRITGLIGVILSALLFVLMLLSGQFFTVIILFFIAQGAWKAWKEGSRAVGI